MNALLLQELGKITPEEERLLAGEALDKSIYTSGDPFVIDSGKMLERGRLISIRPHPRFVDFPTHTHNYVELIYMCSGSTTHIINGAFPLTLRAGELLFLNQHVSHAILRAERDDVAVNFIVLPQFFDTAFEMIGADNVLGQFLAGSLQRQGGDISYLHFQVADVPPVQNIVENMVWSVIEHQPNDRRISRITMGLLFLQLLNYTGRLAFAGPQKGGSALVVEALREIEENYKTASLGGIAQRHGVSLSYVSRLVRAAAGAPFKLLLRQKRLAKAAQLLETTRLSIQEVVAAVGYENTSYFYREFEKTYGMAPKAYRSSSIRTRNF